MKFKKTPKFLRSIGIVLAIIAAVVIYAYGFQVTKVNLEETRSERRQTQLVRIIRALAKPDIIVYDKQVTDASARIMVPCPTDGYQTPETDKNKPYIVIEPACADPETEVKISGFNFAPNSGGPLYFIPPSEVTLDLGRITTDADGKFEMMAKLPDRPDTAVQYINAITRVEVGIPKLSSNVIDTWDKIVETVFLALLATTVGTLLAIPFSFLAARNIMKDVTSPLLSVALILIFVPIGIFLGGQIGKYAILFRETIGVNLIIDLFGFLIVSTGIFFLLKLVLPQEEIQKPTGKIKALRYAGLLLAFFMTILSLSMLSAFMLVAGKWLGMNLGAVGFLGKFISSIGDILGMLLTLFAALVGGGVFLSFANRIGEFSIRHIKYVPNRIINYFMSAIAGAFALVIIASGIGWVYEVTNPVNIYFIPAGIGALLGLLTAFKYKPRDKVGIGMVLYYASRTIFNALRSIEALIMVIVFVVWVGIGPFAGVLALSLHTVAALAKLYSEQVESILAGPIEAVKATGANRLQTIIYAVVPQIIPPYISFTMYRWDINVRMSTIIGFAGGGGIGFLLIQNINLLNYRAASTQMIAIALVVASMDYLSSRLREKTI